MNILVVTKSSGLVEEVVRLASEAGNVTSVQSPAKSLVGVHNLPVQDGSALLLLDCSRDAHAELEALEEIAVRYPRMTTVLLLNQESPDVLLRALRMGVREVLKLPLHKDEFVSAIERIGRHQGNEPVRQGEVMAFISCKGGSGSTFLAANVGYSLAAHSKKRVLLIDLNLQFGDAALFVSDRKPTATILDVCHDIERIDESLLRSSVIEVLPNFGVLAAPEDASKAVEIRPNHIDALIRFVRPHFDYVICDVGRSLDAITVHALDAADHIYLVLQLILPYVRDGRRLMALFHSLGYPREKIRPIVNRYEKSNDLRLEDLEQALTTKIFHTVPNHYPSVAASVNQGTPIDRLRPGSPVSESILRLVESITQQGGAREHKNWLAKMLRRE